MIIVRGLEVHDCDLTLFEAFAATFGEKVGGTSRWTEFDADGVRVTLFAPRVQAEIGGDDDRG